MKLELAEVQMGQIFGRFFWGDNIISDYFDGKFCFYRSIRCRSSFLKRMKLFLVKGFYLSFVKRIKSIFNKTWQTNRKSC